MKKSILIIVLSLLLIFSLTACSSGNSGSQESSSEGEKSDKESSQSSESSEAAKAEEPTTIKVGSSFTYYPFGFMDGEQKTGFEVDVWKEIGKRTGLEVEHVQASFSGLFGMLDKGEIDTIANQISMNPEREEKYNFSSPYCYNPLKLIVPKGNPENIQSLKDMVGKKVTTGIGGNENDIIKEMYPNNEIELVPVETGNLMQVIAGKTSATLQGAAAASVEIKDKNLDLEIVGESIYLEVNAYPFAKNERGNMLREKVSKAIEEMHVDGTMKELAIKWFGYDISKPE